MACHRWLWGYGWSSMAGHWWLRGYGYSSMAGHWWLSTISCVGTSVYQLSQLYPLFTDLLSDKSLIWPTLFRPAPGVSAFNLCTSIIIWMGPQMAMFCKEWSQCFWFNLINHLVLDNASWGVFVEKGECGMVVALVLNVAGWCAEFFLGVRVCRVCGAPNFLKLWNDKSTEVLSGCFFLPPS